MLCSVREAEASPIGRFIHLEWLHNLFLRHSGVLHSLDELSWVVLAALADATRDYETLHKQLCCFRV